MDAATLLRILRRYGMVLTVDKSGTLVVEPRPDGLLLMAVQFRAREIAELVRAEGKAHADRA